MTISKTMSFLNIITGARNLLMPEKCETMMLFLKDVSLSHAPPLTSMITSFCPASRSSSLP